MHISSLEIHRENIKNLFRFYTFLFVFLLHQMLFFIEVFAILLFPAFKLIFYQYCALFTNLWFYCAISHFTPSYRILFIFILYFYSCIKNNLYYDFRRTIKKSSIIPSTYLQNSRFYIPLFLFVQILLSRCGDIEDDSRPKYSTLTCCHWNSNWVIAYDSTKKSFIQAYIT